MCFAKAEDSSSGKAKRVQKAGRKMVGAKFVAAAVDDELTFALLWLTF